MEFIFVLAFCDYEHAYTWRQRLLDETYGAILIVRSAVLSKWGNTNWQKQKFRGIELNSNQINLVMS